MLLQCQVPSASTSPSFQVIPARLFRVCPVARASASFSRNSHSSSFTRTQVVVLSEAALHLNFCLFRLPGNHDQGLTPVLGELMFCCGPENWRFPFKVLKWRHHKQSPPGRSARSSPSLYSNIILPFKSLFVE